MQNTVKLQGKQALFLNVVFMLIPNVQLLI